MTQLRIFVSHSRVDHAVCDALVKALREAGADVWYEDGHLDTGRDMEEIERELQASPVFLVLLLPAAVSSDKVKEESSLADRLAKRDPSRLILPVLVTPLDPGVIWPWLQHYQRVEAADGTPFYEDERIRKTLSSLALTPGGPEANQSPSDLLTRGKALTAQGKQAEALPYFEQANQIDPSAFEAWFNLGYAFEFTGQWAKAMAAFDRATMFGPHERRRLEQSWERLRSAWPLAAGAQCVRSCAGPRPKLRLRLERQRERIEEPGPI